MVETPLSAEQAGYARDALAKHVYSHVFDWIVKMINGSLAADADAASDGALIGVLDIYGFETFPVNRCVCAHVCCVYTTTDSSVSQT